ncbi:CDP-alcohol phosphatidyltransferase [Actinopolyspora mzabensis]|uniref:CDP-alcohol phosphatidyltransferase n=1 Tax=Actinopolyspora mzabensis TaxID=995066 RepID=A0A1G8YR71_ACTMZ|nr:CDP-alcohol phosphatidyltransferase family protein [Actinopolyspora mzabensis]SDK05339.1 CDP-alcohol phosphatidyltransferase [Actinopolyspora mzabensis]
MRGPALRSGSRPGNDRADSAFREALHRLPGAQKSAGGAPAYSRFINRKAGGYLAAAAYPAGFTPNQVTTMSAVFTFGGILGLATVPPSRPLGVIVALTLLLGYALDSADGQLARLRGGGNPAGEWLDHIVDSTKIPTLHLAVLLSTFRFGDTAHAWLLVPLGFAVTESVLFFAMILNDQLRRAHSKPSSASSTNSTSSGVTKSLLVAPTDYGVLCLCFILLGDRIPFMTVYTMLFAAHLCFACLALPKWFREMRALCPPDSGR